MLRWRSTVQAGQEFCAGLLEEFTVWRSRQAHTSVLRSWRSTCSRKTLSRFCEACAVAKTLCSEALQAQRGDRQHNRAMIDAADLDELNPAAGASLAIALLACCLIVCCSVLRMLCSCTEALRDKLHEVIFEADTLGGKVFDVSLLVAILASVSTVLAESVHEYRTEYGREFRTAELSFTGLFAVEYALRLVAVQRPLAYALSFFGVVDLLSIVPTFLESFVPGATHLRAIRVLRLLRVFRVLKLVGFHQFESYTALEIERVRRLQAEAHRRERPLAGRSC